MAVSNRFGKLDPGHLRHHVVADDGFDFWMTIKDFERLSASPGREDRRDETFQPQTDRLKRCGRVVDNQDDFGEFCR